MKLIRGFMLMILLLCMSGIIMGQNPDETSKNYSGDQILFGAYENTAQALRTIQAYHAVIQTLDTLKSSGTAAADTVRKTMFSGIYKSIYLSVTDTSGGDPNLIVDSLKIYVTGGADTTYWSQVSVKAILGDTLYSVAAPGKFFSDQTTTKTYLINFPRPYWVKVVLSNVIYVADRLVKLRWYAQ